jgi:hypothetical protein
MLAPTYVKSLVRIFCVILSVLMIVSATYKMILIFYIFVFMNFVLMHSIWVIPLIRRNGSQGTDQKLFRFVLLVFGTAGLLSALIFPEAIS